MPGLSYAEGPRDCPGHIKLLIWASFLTEVFAVLILITSQGVPPLSSGYSTPVLQDGLRNTGLALQVPNGPDDIYDVLGKSSDHSGQAKSDRTTATWSQYFDFGLIPSYVVLFVASGLLQLRSSKSARRWLGPATAVFAAAAGFFDVFEDIGILHCISKLNEGLELSKADTDAISVCGWTKWGLLFLMLFCVAPLVLERSAKSLGSQSAALRWIGLLFGISMIWSGAAGCIAWWLRSRLRLETAAVGITELPAYFFPLYALFSDGMERGLDRIIEWRLFWRWRVFKWLTTWTNIAPTAKQRSSQ